MVPSIFLFKVWWLGMRERLPYFTVNKTLLLFPTIRNGRSFFSVALGRHALFWDLHKVLWGNSTWVMVIFQKVYSWPLRNTCLNCMGPFICGYFSINNIGKNFWRFSAVWKTSQMHSLEISKKFLKRSVTNAYMQILVCFIIYSPKMYTNQLWS